MPINLLDSCLQMITKTSTGKLSFFQMKKLQNFYNGRTYVRRPRGQAWNERYVIRVNRSRQFTVNLWGYITPNTYDPFHLPDRHTKESYLDVLKKAKIDEIAESRIFMHDNAAIHKAKIVKKYLTDEEVEVLPWPARSPDLNSIENIWAMMQRKVYDRMLLSISINTKKRLFALCKLCFQEACEQTFEKLYQSVEKRISSVIDLKGA